LIKENQGKKWNQNFLLIKHTIHNVFVSKNNILEGGHQLRHPGTTLGQADTFH